MSKRIRIAVAEPSVILREGILSVLKQMDLPHLDLYEIEDLARLRSALILHKPDLLIINPSHLGLFSVAQLRKETTLPELKLVALQWSVSETNALRSYDAILSIYDQPGQIREKLSRIIHAEKPDQRHESLSEREKEVIACVVRGMTNKQIADQLCLSAHTIVTHRRNISAKLDIHSTAGLTIYAIVNKLVELDEVHNTDR